MHELMPGGPGFFNTYIPRPFGTDIHILFGNPIRLDDLLQNHKQLESSPKVIYKAIADRIEEELRKLEEELKEIIKKGNNS